jgi:flagellar basal-body rod protein FlgG
MLQALYAAASGMEAQQAQFDAVSNDMANLATPGYQSTVVGFQDMLYTSGGSASGSSVGTGAGSSARIIGRNQTQGEMQPTGRSLDVAIGGAGYLQVRRADGSTGLTRNGSLALDAQRRLTNQQGMPLQPPVTIPSGVSVDQLKISPAGVVSAGTSRLGQISLVTVPAPGKMFAGGGSTFSPSTASGATRPATGSVLQQGSLETSNVNVAQDMTEMIAAERSYSIASQAIKYQDQMLQIAKGIKK